MRALPFVFIVFNLITFALTGQKAPVDIKWGEEYKEPRNSVLTEFIGKDADGFYALRQGLGEGFLSKEGSIFIERYNSRMKLVKTNEIKLTYKKKDLVFEDIQLINGDLVLFTSFKNRKKKTHYLFSQTISKKSLKPRTDFQIISQVPTRTQFAEGTFSLEFSRDSSKILVFSQLPYKNKSPEKYHIKVMDQNLESLWENDITLPYSDEKFRIKEYRVDKQGNVFVLGQISPDGFSRMKKGGRPNYQYTLLTYTKDETLAPEYKIDLEDKFITELTFRIQKNGDPVCAGFYSDRSTNSMRGTYFFKIDKSTGNVYNINLKEFEFDFLTELLSDRKKRRAQRAEENDDQRRQVELFEYDLDRLVLRSDGGAVLIAEQYYITQENERFRDMYGFWQTRVTNRYHYNDIIVVNINPAGEIDWATHVPKRQVTQNDGGYFSSYAIAVTGKAIYLAFNDNAKNYDRNLEANRTYAFNGSRSVVTLAEVRPDGSMSRHILFSNRDEGILTRPKVCRQIGRDKIVIYGERNRKYKFAEVDFQ